MNANHQVTKSMVNRIYSVYVYVHIFLYIYLFIYPSIHPSIMNVRMLEELECNLFHAKTLHYLFWVVTIVFAIIFLFYDTEST